jgi:hypothetical protein
MERVVQQNASLVEQATAAAESMKEQAQALLQLVSRFSLEAQRARAPGGGAPAPIRVRKGAALPPAYAAALASSQRARSRPAPAAPPWDED